MSSRGSVSMCRLFLSGKSVEPLLSLPKNSLVKEVECHWCEASVSHKFLWYCGSCWELAPSLLMLLCCGEHYRKLPDLCSDPQGSILAWELIAFFSLRGHLCRYSFLKYICIAVLLWLLLLQKGLACLKKSSLVVFLPVQKENSLTLGRWVLRPVLSFFAIPDTLLAEPELDALRGWLGVTGLGMSAVLWFQCRCVSRSSLSHVGGDEVWGRAAAG